MVIEGRQFDPASEEICFLRVQTDKVVVINPDVLQNTFRAAMTDATGFGRRELVFLIRPKGSNDGRELLEMPNRLAGSISTVTG